MTTKSLLKSFRDPFVQFLLAGIALYIAFSLTATEDPAVRDRQITLDASTLEWIHGNFTKQFRRPPTASELDSLVRKHIEHEVKYREALTLGLDERDSIVQRRLIQKFDFLFGDAAAELEPGDTVLQAWYETHKADYETPATISFTHLWFSPDARRSDAEHDARAAAAALNAGEIVESDQFPFDTTFTNATQDQVRRVFGQDFVDRVFEVEVNTWTAPIASGLGFHAVRVAARTQNVNPPLAQIHESVLQDWRQAESQSILERTTIQLLKEYRVSIDEDALSALEITPESQDVTP